MGRKCSVCGRGARVGSKISHADNVTIRRFHINLQRVKVKIGDKTRRVLVCTRCLHAGKVKKVK